MLQPNDQAGPYTLVKFLGEGAFGQVWLAEKTTTLGTRLRVALKLLNLQLVDLDAIRQEAAVWETLKHHPHIVTLVDVEKYTVNGAEYVGIASLYQSDGSLADWLARHGGRAPSTQAAVEMTLGILDGLACLHEQTPPVIHRDLKPANILMQGQRPLLADFGLARALRSGKDYSHSRHWAGTLPYMAPESFDPEHSFRTDIWSVGVMLYRMLGRRLPFDKPDQPSQMKAIILDDPPPLPASVPPRLCEIVGKSLAKNKMQRYQNVAQMGAALRAYQTGGAAPTEVDPEKTILDEEAQRRLAKERAAEQDRQRQAQEQRKQAAARRQAEEAERQHLAKLEAHQHPEQERLEPEMDQHAIAEKEAREADVESWNPKFLKFLAGFWAIFSLFLLMLDREQASSFVGAMFAFCALVFSIFGRRRK